MPKLGAIVKIHDSTSLATLKRWGVTAYRRPDGDGYDVEHASGTYVGRFNSLEAVVLSLRAKGFSGWRVCGTCDRLHRVESMARGRGGVGYQSKCKGCAAKEIRAKELRNAGRLSSDEIARVRAAFTRHDARQRGEAVYVGIVNSPKRAFHNGSDSGWAQTTDIRSRAELALGGTMTRNQFHGALAALVREGLIERYSNTAGYYRTAEVVVTPTPVEKVQEEELQQNIPVVREPAQPESPEVDALISAGPVETLALSKVGHTADGTTVYADQSGALYRIVPL